MTRRIDPRRPAITTAAGLRRIVLGSELGDRAGPGQAAAVAAVRPLRSAGPFKGCIVVVTQVEAQALDEPAREAISAACLIARPDEAVVLLAIGPCGDDLGACGVDEARILQRSAGHAPHRLATVLLDHLIGLAPRHVLVPDRGADADLGRRLAVLTGWPTATQVVEWHEGRVRVRSPGSDDRCAPAPRLALLTRGVAPARLPFVGQGRASTLACPLDGDPGIDDLGQEAGDPQHVALDEADFIIAAGNGVTDVALFQELAKALGAATGASRVAVDDGRFPRSRQVGATGVTVRARGYLAFGISGAVQHLQGIKECRHVLAVNTDRAAPIAQRAELTVVADAQALMRALLALARQHAARA